VQIPRPATKVNLDKNWTVCDNQRNVSPFFGHCYTEFDNFGQGDLEYMSTSVGGGQTWSAPVSPVGNPKGLGGQQIVQRNGTPVGRPARLLLGLTGALLALLVLNLAVFDDLRIDPSAGVLETFIKPQHAASLVAVLIAGGLVAFKHRSAARVAVLVAWIEISAFAFFHVIPVEIGPSKPYWGDGMADALQWVGLLSILAVSGAIVGVARRASTGTVAPVAARL
jgi:hypothetical protein